MTISTILLLSVREVDRFDVLIVFARGANRSHPDGQSRQVSGWTTQRTGSGRRDI